MTQHTPGENFEHDQPCSNPTHAGQTYAQCGHTPGPWKAYDDDGTGTLPCVLSDKVNAGGNFYVAQCNVFADARLIAAAPEMYEMLKTLAFQPCDHVVYGCSISCPYACPYAKARALLVRIEGRGSET